LKHTKPERCRKGM